MSVNLMSAIFEVEFFDLKDEEGNVTKASTAKLVLLAMADHANDEGEGAYPSIEKLCRKTALSEQTIRNTFDALRYNGIIALEGKSKYGTNNHTINTKAFPRAKEKEVTHLTLYPLGGSNEYSGGSNEYRELTLPVIPEPLLNIQEPSSEIALPARQEPNQKHTAYNRGEQERPDVVAEHHNLYNQPGLKQQARIDALLSAFGVAFVVNSETAEWKKFAKYAISEQKLKGWDPEQFITWVKAQKGYPEFWSCRRMMGEYPKAFVKNEEDANGSEFRSVRLERDL